VEGIKLSDLVEQDEFMLGRRDTCRIIESIFSLLNLLGRAVVWRLVLGAISAWVTVHDDTLLSTTFSAENAHFVAYPSSQFYVFSNLLKCLLYKDIVLFL